MFLSSTANLKCTPSDGQMYPWGYMWRDSEKSWINSKRICCCYGPDHMHHRFRCKSSTFHGENLHISTPFLTICYSGICKLSESM